MHNNQVDNSLVYSGSLCSENVVMIHLVVFGISTLFAIATVGIIMTYKRNSVADQSSEPSGDRSSVFRKVSEVAKRFSVFNSDSSTKIVTTKRNSVAQRFSEGFIGLISKAYHSKSPEPDYSAVDFFSNPLKSHISEAVSAMRTPSSTIELITAIRTLGHISITGGNETSGYIGKFIIPDLAAKFKNPLEDFEVKLAAVEAISEMCAYCMKDNQDLCKEYGILQFLIEGLRHHSTNKELLRRQWCAHGLYYCIANNPESSNYVRNYNVWLDLQNLSNYMHPDETMWEFNDAEMLLEMLRR